MDAYAIQQHKVFWPPLASRGRCLGDRDVKAALTWQQLAPVGARMQLGHSCWLSHHLLGQEAEPEQNAAESMPPYHQSYHLRPVISVK